MAEVALGANEFRALSSKTRVEIIKLLGMRKHNLTEMANKLGMRLPTIKQHLGVLERAGLIEQLESARKWKYYSLTAKGNALVGKSEASVLIVLALAGIAMVGLLYEFFSKFGNLFSGIARPVASNAPLNAGELTTAAAPVLEAGKEAAMDSAEKVAGQAVAEASASDIALYAIVFVALALIIAFFIVKVRKRSRL